MDERHKSAIYKALIIAGVLVFSFFLRIYSLESDPPDYLTWSAAIYVDEGYKAIDARNTIKFGSTHWSPYDAYKGHFYDSRVFYDIQVWIFENFGLSVLNLRYFNIAVSLAIILIVLLTLSFVFTSRFIVLMGIVFAINIVYLFHSRIALYELPMIMIGVLMWPALFLFFNRNIFKKNMRRFWYLIFVVFLLVSVTSVGTNMKGSFLIFMGSIVASFLLSASLPYFLKKGKVIFGLTPHKIFNYALIGILILTVVLYASQFVITEQKSRYLANPLMLIAKLWFLEIIYLQPNVFFLSVLCCIAILKIFYNGRFAHYGKEKLLEYQMDLFFALQMIFSFLIVYISSYSPLRYFLFSEISIIYLACRFVNNYDEEIKILRSRASKKRSIIRNIIIFLFVFYVVIQLIIVVVMLFINYESRKIIFDDFYLNLVKGNLNNPSAYMVFMLIFIVIPFVYYIAKNYDDVAAFIRRHMSRKIMVFLLLEIQIIYLLSWQFNKTGNIRECMNFVNRLPEDRVVIGDWAPMLALESDLKIIYSSIQDKRNIDNIPKIKPDYIVVNSNKNEEEIYNQVVPGLIKHENLMYGFKVQAFNINIYRVDLYH